MYSLITFQCSECGLVYKALIRNNHELFFHSECGVHSNNQCLTKSNYFKCIRCKAIDNTKKFEKVYC